MAIEQLCSKCGLKPRLAGSFYCEDDQWQPDTNPRITRESTSFAYNYGRSSTEYAGQAEADDERLARDKADWIHQSHKRILTGLFRDRESAEAAYNLILNQGYSKDDVNILMADATRNNYFRGGDDSALGSRALEGAGTGSAVGGTLGAIIGGIAAIGTNVLLPGLGLIVAGPLAAALAGASGLTGGLVGVLMGSGIPEDRARVYEEGIRNGGIVISVAPLNDEDAAYFENEWRRRHGEYIYR